MIYTPDVQHGCIPYVLHPSYIRPPYGHVDGPQHNPVEGQLEFMYTWSATDNSGMTRTPPSTPSRNARLTIPWVPVESSRPTMNLFQKFTLFSDYGDFFWGGGEGIFDIS